MCISGMISGCQHALLLRSLFCNIFLTLPQLWFSGDPDGGSHIGHLPCSTPITWLVRLVQSSRIYSCERDWGTMRKWPSQEIYWTNEEGIVRASSFTSALSHPVFFTIQCWCNCLRAPNVQGGGVGQSSTQAWTLDLYFIEELMSALVS